MQKMAYSSSCTPTNSSSAVCLPHIPLLHLGSAWGKQSVWGMWEMLEKPSPKEEV